MPVKYNGNLVEKARELRKNATPWENKLWYEFLNKYTPRFQRQRIIGNYIVDFYCSKAYLAIELDGGGHYEEEKAQQDAVRTENINRQGIEVMRFSDFDIDTNFYEVCSEIDRRVKEKYKAV